MSEAMALIPAEDQQRLHTLAAEVITIREQVKVYTFQAALLTGKRLMEAKALCPHGQWGGYLGEVGYKERTAQTMMQLYEEYGEGMQAPAFADLTYTKALALLGVPKDEREQFAEENPVADMSTRELQKRVAELKAERDTIEEESKRFREEYTELVHNIEKLTAQDHESNAIMEEMRGRVTALTAQLETAKAQAAQPASTARDKEAMKKLKEALKAAQARIEKAEAEARAAAERPPATVVETKEVTPPELMAELDRLREQAKKAPCEAVVLVRAAYDGLIAAFDRVLPLLVRLGQEMPEEEVKYRAAIGKAARIMADKIEG